jgi:hypothetical protein
MPHPLHWVRSGTQPASFEAIKTPSGHNEAQSPQKLHFPSTRTGFLVRQLPVLALLALFIIIPG